MGRLRTWLYLNRERLLVWLVVALLFVVAFLFFAGAPFDGSNETDQSASGDLVEIERIDDDYRLTPETGTSDTGLVFYPGGRVTPDAYVESLSPIVEQANVTVVIVKMPLNLAVLDQGVATDVIDRNPDIKQWYVGGHSLGGAMACRYARDHPGRVSGVVLFGAYCDESLAGTDLRVLSVTGQEDTVMDRSAYERNKENYPSDTTFRSLPSVNHTQFGSYTGQAGDQPSGTSYRVAHRRLANATVPWFRTASATP